MMNQDNGLKKRLLAVLAVITAGLSVLSARLVYVQVVDHERYTKAALSHYTHREVLPATRGEIFSSDGDLLARSQVVYSLVVDCHHIRDPLFACAGLAKKYGKKPRAIRQQYDPDEINSTYIAWIVSRLAKPLRLRSDELSQRLKGKVNGEIMLARDIEEDESRRLREIMRENRIGGIYFRKEERRFYPSPLTLTQVVGYVGERKDEDEDGNETYEIEGKEGIEKVFDGEMRGEAGYRYIERDNRKREILAFRGDEKTPRAGNNIHLTIDMGLQVAIEQVLDQTWEQYSPEKVTAIWMRPKTGEILAMASRPHFDLATRKGTRRNIAVTDLFEPGSTFKIVAFGGALDKRLISLSTEINCHSANYTAEGFTMGDHHPYGILTAKGIVARSSNIGAYMIARQLNRGGFMSYVKSFGFGDRTGIELTAENAGVVHPIKTWSQTSFSSTSIGYSISVTPLQMIQAYSVIANGGELRPPTILKSIENPNRKAFHVPPPKPVRRVLSERAAKDVRLALMAVLEKEEHGTGTRAAMPGYTLAGKTGTAKKNVEGRGYVNGRYVCSFAGFLPAEDPELVGLVIVDDPRAEGMKLYGGTVAAPIFKEMATKAVRILGIPPQDAEEYRLAEIGEEAESAMPWGDERIGNITPLLPVPSE